MRVAVVRQWQLQRRLSTIRSRARALPRRIRNLIDVGRTHVEMFGYVSAARAALAKLIDPKYGRERFDATHGVDTHPWTLADSQIPPETMGEAIHYEPAHTGVLHHVFRSLPFRHEDYHLVDLGSGKGRTLLSRNSSRAETRCTAIDVHCENAVDFTVPRGNLLVTMYNPFFGQTFQ